MRVRKVVTRSGKRFRGKSPSAKLGRMVHWESLLERDAILHLEYHPLVISYQEQPSVEVYYDAVGAAHRYVPDFLVVFSDGAELCIEVKPSRQLKKQEIRNKLGAVAVRFEELGREFRVWTEDLIRREPLFSNLKALKRGTKTASALKSSLGFDRLVSEGSDWTFSEVMRAVGSPRDVLGLLRVGRLHADLESRLIEDTNFWLPGSNGGSHGSFRV